MKLTQATDYAFRIVLYLTKKREEVIEAEVIADVEKIPKRFLLKICRDLAMGGIIDSSRGKNGGYKLAKDPEKITLKDVFTAIEGDIILNKCQEDPKACSKDASSYCVTHHTLFLIRDILAKEFDKYDFATLAGQHRKC
ncbi:MAG: Rrf2 family transcriptional regulator [Thermincola sp.]|jgi:Rrf2 family protein|nr:Rrf2 family transcriptional regulator [Thermincola sp.]MDT3704082.1 Rrf2 family transcriptional regulator [Thermincola sp.]